MPDHFDISTILDGCRKVDRNSQRKLYEHFYGYAISICLRYVHDRGEAAEILNEGFLRHFEISGNMTPESLFAFGCGKS